MTDQGQEMAKHTEETIVSIRNVGKAYDLYDRPQDRLQQMFLGRFGKSYKKEFWALRDVSFDLRRGETLGIIGRNGSGKSTLLQIIAGIVQPTRGEVSVNGRVAALLELGSGFDPEYTGRENILINGAILGVPLNEMRQRQKDIIAFADIGEFIDQPVKLYSSGMFVRLAFAIATTVDAEVLLIDEALAVGDIFFRQKCYSRLETLRNKGVAIVLVSHAMADVEQFCRQALLLHHGELIFEGSASGAVKRYYLVEQGERVDLLTVAEQKTEPFDVLPSTEGHDVAWPPAEAFMDISSFSQISNGGAHCTGVALCDVHGQPSLAFAQGATACFFYEFELLQDIEVPIGGILIKNDKNVIIHGKSTLEYGTKVPTSLARGSRLRFRQEIALEIEIGEYTFEVGLAAVSRDHYQRRAMYSHPVLAGTILRLCHLPEVGQFAVIFRLNRDPVQLLHHGVANLPGRCQVTIVPGSFPGIVSGVAAE